MKYIKNTKQSESGKYNHYGDCQTYSLAYLFDKDYDEVYKELENASTHKSPINDNHTINKVLWRNNYKLHIYPYELTESKKLTVEQLARLLKDTNIKVAVEVKDHITVIDNGNVVDKWDCSRRYVQKIYLTIDDYKQIEYMLKYTYK